LRIEFDLHPKMTDRLLRLDERFLLPLRAPRSLPTLPARA